VRPGLALAGVNTRHPLRLRLHPPRTQAPMMRWNPRRMRLASRRVRYGRTASPTVAGNILCIFSQGVSIPVSLVAGVLLPPGRRLVVTSRTAPLLMESLRQTRCRLHRTRAFPPRVSRDPRLTGAFAFTGGEPFVIIHIQSPVLCAAFPIRMMVTAIGGQEVAGAESLLPFHVSLAAMAPPARPSSWLGRRYACCLLSRWSFGCAIGQTRVFDVWVCHRSHCV
jgi:hypothetical protein